MNKPVFRVVGLDHATCDKEYAGAETSTQPSSARVLQAHYSETLRIKPETVQVRLGDVLSVFQESVETRLAWVDDFQDDPVVITKDLYDVLLTFQRFRKSA